MSQNIMNAFMHPVVTANNDNMRILQMNKNQQPNRSALSEQKKANDLQAAIFTTRIG